MQTRIRLFTLDHDLIEVGIFPIVQHRNYHRSQTQLFVFASSVLVFGRE